MSCGFTHLDGAYVLGSLSPAERADYERHLAGCATCSQSVRELAGIPGLLARVPADILEPAATDPAPATLLPALVVEARREQRRRTTRVALLAAAAVAVIACSAAAVSSLDEDPAPRPPAAVETSAPQELTPVGGSSSSGWVSLTPVSWGTRLDLTCAYEAAYPGAEAWTYRMVVLTTDGRVEQVATWKALPGRELQVTGATAVSAAEIAAVEVRTSDGDPVLRLAL